MACTQSTRSTGTMTGWFFGARAGGAGSSAGSAPSSAPSSGASGASSAGSSGTGSPMPSACSALSYFTAAAQYEPQRGMPKNLILSSRTTFATKARDGYCRTASLAASASVRVFWASSNVFWASANVACAPSSAFSASAKPSGSASSPSRAFLSSTAACAPSTAAWASATGASASVAGPVASSTAAVAAASSSSYSSRCWNRSNVTPSAGSSSLTPPLSTFPAMSQPSDAPQKPINGTPSFSPFRPT